MSVNFAFCWKCLKIIFLWPFSELFAGTKYKEINAWPNQVYLRYPQVNIGSKYSNIYSALPWACLSALALLCLSSDVLSRLECFSFLSFNASSCLCFGTRSAAMALPSVTKEDCRLLVWESSPTSARPTTTAGPTAPLSSTMASEWISFLWCSRHAS